jgi:fermentation-respiration switch protein FrsA (DUF1100 family)
MKQKFLSILLLILFCSGCSHLFYQPTKKHFLDPKQFKLTYEDVFFTSKDGTKLHGWFFKAKTQDVKGTVVQFHGNAQNISTHFFSLIWMIDHGYNLFTFDYRGYGKSEGEGSQKGVYEDALAAIETGHSFYAANGAGKFIIYGQSLGGIISSRAVVDSKYKDEITLLVQDSTFSSYQNLAFEKTSHSWLLFIVSPLVYVLVSDEYASDKVLDKLKIPVLVIVNQKDDVIPQKFGKKIYKKLKTEKWLWKYPNGRHIETFHHDQGRARGEFLRLLDQLPQR